MALPSRHLLPLTAAVWLAGGACTSDIADTLGVDGGVSTALVARDAGPDAVVTLPEGGAGVGGDADPCLRDRDSDGAADCDDECPDDPGKQTAGGCGCGITEVDSDADETPDCADDCPLNPSRISSAPCGCAADDTDEDGSEDCIDDCPDDALKVGPGVCGCQVPDVDADEDGVADCVDRCVMSSTPDGSACGCESNPDGDEDGVPDCADECPEDPEKVSRGACGCGNSDADRDGDDAPDCEDECPTDGEKTSAGACGCGLADDDGDGDATPDCQDACSSDPSKTEPGSCGCGSPETPDSDQDDLLDCLDACPEDGAKAEPGSCGCGSPETPDSDQDGLLDCLDGCPEDEEKTEPLLCGCGFEETPDSDDDDLPDCLDACPEEPTKGVDDVCGCDLPDTTGAGGVEICVELRDSLRHRYSFETGRLMRDSEGDADGTLIGSGTSQNGMLTLSAGAHVELPTDVLDDLTNATLEAWYVRLGGNAWQRLFDFGDNDGTSGTSFVYLSPQALGSMRVGLRSIDGTATDLVASDLAPLDTVEHVALVLDDGSNQALLYRNGTLATSGAWTTSLEEIALVHNWLGRSQFSADPGFEGSIAEFRIYEVALDAASVAYAFVAGPDPVFLED